MRLQRGCSGLQCKQAIIVPIGWAPCPAGPVDVYRGCGWAPSRAPRPSAVVCPGRCASRPRGRPERGPWSVPAPSSGVREKLQNRPAVWRPSPTEARLGILRLTSSQPARSLPVAEKLMRKRLRSSRRALPHRLTCLYDQFARTCRRTRLYVRWRGGGLVPQDVQPVRTAGPDGPVRRWGLALPGAG